MKICGLMFFLVVILVFNGCSTDLTTEGNDKVNGTWSLINVSGGFAGVDDDFEKGKIVWKFNAADGSLTITNNDASSAIYNGLPSGTYTYSIIKEKDLYYLLLNDKEIGGVDVAKSQLMIDQNITTSGSGADGFLLKLIKQAGCQQVG